MKDWRLKINKKEEPCGHKKMAMTSYEEKWISPHVESLYNSALEGLWESRNFVVIKAHVFRNPLRLQQIFPVELGLAAFSLSEGVQESMSMLICPDPIPTGVGYSIKELQDNTGLPRPGQDEEHFGDGSKDYQTISLELKRFMSKYFPRGIGSPNRKIVFAMETDIPGIKGAFKWLAAKCEGEEFEHVRSFLTDLEYLDLARLYHKLCKLTNKKNAAYMSPFVAFGMDSVTATVLNKPNKYSFRPEISCDYHLNFGHDKMDMCAKSWVLRRIFTILDELVFHLQVNVKNGHAVATYKK